MPYQTAFPACFHDSVTIQPHPYSPRPPFLPLDLLPCRQALPLSTLRIIANALRGASPSLAL